jgi:hypothetical protein
LRIKGGNTLYVGSLMMMFQVTFCHQGGLDYKIWMGALVCVWLLHSKLVVNN